ncbi:MAG TPA: tetratricopeptide repeat protein, partial [Acidimicrobiales bacterium]|nr:tetratricopeptide repeat protein [Acidimicrobiales bacterium]
GSPGAGTELVDTALQWLETAADWAERSHSNYAAGRFHAQRLELLAEDDPRRIAAHLGRARARLGLRELAGALYDAREALAEALRVGDAVSEAHSLNLLGDIATAESDHIRALDVLTRAIDRWRELGQWGGLAEALRLRGMAAMGMGDREAAEADFEKALDIFVELEDSSGEAWCQQNLAWLSFELGHIADAEARLDRAVQLFARNSDAGGLGWALGLAAFVRFHLGDSEEAESIAQLVLTEARKRGDRFGEAMMNLLLASITLWSGRCQEAVDLAEQALQIFRDTGQKYGEVQSLGTLARAKAAVGRMSESRRLLTECMEAATEIPGEPLKAFSHMVAGATAVQSGDPETSLAMLDRSQADREPDLDMRILGSMDRWVTRSMAYLQLGRVADARAVLAAIEEGGPEKKGPYFQTVSAMVELLEGDTAAAMARATGTLDTGRATYLDRRTALLVIALSHTRNGDEEQAITAFDAALAAVDSTDSRLSQTLVRIARAIAYRALDRPDADAREAEAEAASDALGVGVEGWRRLYCEAVGVEPRPVRVGPGPIRSD